MLSPKWGPYFLRGMIANQDSTCCFIQKRLRIITVQSFPLSPSTNNVFYFLLAE